MPLLGPMDAVLWISPKAGLVNSKSYGQGFRKLRMEGMCTGGKALGGRGDYRPHILLGKACQNLLLLVTGGLLSRSCVCMRRLVSV